MRTRDSLLCWAACALTAVLAACGKDATASRPGGLHREQRRQVVRQLLADEPSTPRAEREVTEAIAEAKRTGSSVRVLVRLYGVVDERELADAMTASSPDRNRAAKYRTQFAAAQGRLLDGLSAEAKRSAVRLRRVPYVAFDASLVDLDLLLGRVRAGRAGLELDDGRRASVLVERVRRLRPSTSRAPVLRPGEPSLASIGERIGGTAPMRQAPDPGQGRRIVVIDTAVDPRIEPLIGRVEQRRRITHGYPATGSAEELPPPTGPAPDKLDHGTQVACAAAVVAPEARVISLAVDDGDGGYPFDRVLAAMDFVHTEFGLDGRVDAVCVSIADPDSSSATECGGGTNHATAFAMLTALLGQDGIAVAVAAGNDGPEGQVFFPACITTVVTVSALHAVTNEAADFSNWSDLADLAAPGSTMTVPAVDAYSDPYGVGPGTSVAAPLAAGAISRLRSLYPDRPLDDLVEALTSNPDHARLSPSDPQRSPVELPRLSVDAARNWLDTTP